MSDHQIPDFETDAEFLQLIQPRDEKYVEELEEDIFDHGCHEAICVWGSILIDGHLQDIPSAVNGIYASIYAVSSSRAVTKQKLTYVRSSLNGMTLQANTKNILSADASGQT